ncbi:MAG: hemerythrin [Gammaproteobacteria bacterium HGW-Gammaproteobacteria-1]|jgi:hemerythrin|nr:MAG: hemerythrin [Gammaproteobacteria bacterium HGW-Gammaproteobacteria-1]
MNDTAASPRPASSSSLIDWSDDLSVGIQEIDDQHQFLVDLLNKLHRAIHQRQGKAAAQAILVELVDYTKIHFAVEESLMRILGYPSYDDHKEQHDHLIAEIHDLQEKLESGKKSITFELLHFLRIWLTKHIMEEDQQYGPFFLSRGAVATSEKKSIAGRLWSSLFG